MLSLIRSFFIRILVLLGVIRPKELGVNHLEIVNRLFQDYLGTSYKLRTDSLDKFVVLGVNKMVGLFDKYSEAVRAGYRELGSSAPFLVQQVGSEDIVPHFLAFRAHHVESETAAVEESNLVS